MPSSVNQREVIARVASSHIRITLLVSDLSMTGAGRWGGGVRPFLLAQALLRLGYGVTIVGFGETETISIPSAPCPIQTLPISRYPQFLYSAYCLLQQLQGDVIYAYKLKPSSFGLALLSQWGRSRPVILDIDDWEMSWFGGDEWRYSFSLRQLWRDVVNPQGALRHPDHPLYLKQAERWVKKATTVTTHSQFLQSRFGGAYVPNGKDTDLFDPDRYDVASAKHQYGLTPYRVLMFPGAPRPYKGLEDVLSALDQLNQPELRLVIVGGSPYDAYDEQLIQRWGRWIIKLPVQPYHEMPRAIASADIVVVPQRDVPAAQAQFPLKLTDGMAMAKPVLATRVGDIPKILGDTGYLVRPQSPGDLATTIRHILAYPEEAKQKGLAARQRCLKFYSLDAMAMALSSVFSSSVVERPVA